MGPRQVEQRAVLPLSSTATCRWPTAPVCRRLGLEGGVQDHSTFSENRHGRFRDSHLLRRLFETVLARCIAEGLVGGEASQWTAARSGPM